MKVHPVLRRLRHRRSGRRSAGRDRVRRQGAPGRRLRQDHRHDRPRRGRPGRRAARRSGAKPALAARRSCCSPGSFMHFVIAFVLLFVPRGRDRDRRTHHHGDRGRPAACRSAAKAQTRDVHGQPAPAVARRAGRPASPATRSSRSPASAVPTCDPARHGASRLSQRHAGPGHRSQRDGQRAHQDGRRSASVHTGATAASSASRRSRSSMRVSAAEARSDASTGIRSSATVAISRCTGARQAAGRDSRPVHQGPRQATGGGVTQRGRRRERRPAQAVSASGIELAGEGRVRAADRRLGEHLRRHLQPAAAAAAGRRPPRDRDLTSGSGPGSPGCARRPDPGPVDMQQADPGQRTGSSLCSSASALLLIAADIVNPIHLSNE